MKLVLTLAWRNLWRHSRRTWLTLAAIAFSNTLLVFMISLQFGMYGLMIENTLRLNTGSLQIQAPGYLDDSRIRQAVPDVQHLAAEVRSRLPGAGVAARGAAFALASSEQRSFGLQVLGIEPEHEPEVSSVPGLLSDGRFLVLGDRDAAVIGEVMARNLKAGVGDELTLLGTGRDGSIAAAVVTIVGIFDSGVADFDRSVAYLPMETFQDVFFMRGAGHAVVVSLPELGQVDDAVAQLQPIAAERGLVVHDWDALQPGLKQAIQADISSAFFMYFILVILVAFSVLNTQLMSVLERTREFGIVMALGVSGGRMVRLIFLETTLLGAGGTLLGIAGGALLTGWFQINGFSFPGMDEMAQQFNLPARVFPSVGVLSLTIGPVAVLLFCLLAAIYPAFRLYRLQPVAAMRAA